MNKKKLIISLSAIAVVAAIAIGGTIAYFSDTETSAGNRFVAGDFDLMIDSTCTYNGQTQAFCTWLEQDLDGDLFFNFGDVKPSDSGEDTISFHIIDNDAWLCAEVYNLANADNGCRKPEQLVDDATTSCGNPGAGEGELQDNLFFTVWKDYNCDNAKNGDDYYVVQNQTALAGSWPIADSTTGNPIPGDTTICYAISWEVPLSTNNIIQSDSLTGDIKFTAVQSRGMASFKCSDLTATCGNGVIEGNEECDINDVIYQGWGYHCDEDCTIRNCEFGQGRPCSTGLLGICSGGFQDCTEEGLWGDCIPGNDPTTEICDNGVDDDCDGQVDEDCITCTPTTEVCDGVDNDCDTNSADGSEDPQLGAACDGADTDLCAEGTRSCSDGVLICSDNTGSNVDVCDGVDNDCDANSADGSEDPQLGMACDGTDTDLCMEGTKSCVAGALACSDTSGDTTEICGNGVDDDCDGSVDEGCPACAPITEICGDGIDQNCNGSDLVCTQCATNADCNDNVSCTEDLCTAGTCSNTPHNNWCDDINSCSVDYCNENSGCVYNMSANIGSSCSALGCLLGGSCNGYTCSTIGACVAPQQTPPTGCANCDDANACTTDYCENLICKHTNIVLGQCIFGGSCTAGVVTCNSNPNCPNNCDDGNPCTIDSCGITGCTNTIKICDDNNIGTYDTCDPTNGQCSNIQLPTFEFDFCLVLPWGGQWCLSD